MCAVVSAFWEVSLDSRNHSSRCRRLKGFSKALVVKSAKSCVKCKVDFLHWPPRELLPKVGWGEEGSDA